MGLDAIEMIMDVEEKFGINLPDEDCSRLRIVADLTELVIARLTRLSGGCPTQQAFYEVRRTLTAAGIQPPRLRPSTAIRVVFPSLNRATWKRLCGANRRFEVIAARSPGRFSIWLIPTVFILTAFACVRADSLGGCVAFLIAAIAAIAINCVYRVVQNVRPVELAPAVVTFGDLARAITRVESPPHVNEQETMDEVRRIVAQRVGLPLQRVQPDSEFVRDLGLG